MTNLARADWRVEPVGIDSLHELVAAFHYTRSGSNTATFRHGLFAISDPLSVWGIAWWIPPTRSAAAAVWPENPTAVLTLTRLVLVPEAPRNAASFLIARSVRIIARDARWHCLVTYADRREMLDLGYVDAGSAAKHRFRKVLPAARAASVAGAA